MGAVCSRITKKNQKMMEKMHRKWFFFIYFVTFTSTLVYSVVRNQSIVKMLTSHKNNKIIHMYGKFHLVKMIFVHDLRNYFYLNWIEVVHSIPYLVVIQKTEGTLFLKDINLKISVYIINNKAPTFDETKLELKKDVNKNLNM